MAQTPMKKFIVLLILLAIAALTVYAGSPYYKVYQLKQAYTTKDGKVITESVDFIQLRANVQSQLQSEFADTLAQYPIVAQLGGAPLTVTADKFIARSVNGALTVQNVAQLVETQGQVNQSTKELAAAWAIASNQVNLRNLVQDIIVQQGDIEAVIKAQVEQMVAKQATDRQVSSNSDLQPRLYYCGVNCFKVEGQIRNYPIAMQMQRQGLIDWEIVDITLPYTKSEN